MATDEDVAVRLEIEEKYGKLWTTDEAMSEFTFHAFSAPFVTVTRKSDGKRGSMIFTHAPRFYFDFKPHN